LVCELLNEFHRVVLGAVVLDDDLIRQEFLSRDRVKKFFNPVRSVERAEGNRDLALGTGVAGTRSGGLLSGHRSAVTRLRCMKKRDRNRLGVSYPE
jgi:hypothetical protein